jgi:hypothetical protein
LPAGVISISTPISSSGSAPSWAAASASRSAAASAACSAATSPAPVPSSSSSRRRARAGGPRPRARAAGARGRREEPRRELLEVLRGRGERLLERLADLAVRLADEAPELAQGGLEVRALALELLDVGQRLVVLGLGERVDGAELLPAPREPLDAAAQLLGHLRLQRGGRGLGRQAEALGELAELVPGLLVLVARLLGADLGGRQRLVGLAQRGLDLGLLAGAGAQLGGDALPRLPVGGELGVGRLHPDREDLQVAASAAARRSAHGHERALALELAGQEGHALVALGALAGAPLGVAPLGRELALDLRAADGARGVLGAPCAAGPS